MYKVNLTAEQIQNDFDKLKKLHQEFQKISDEDIESLNEDFYGMLETVKEIARDNNLCEDTAYSYYKLAMWLEMCKEGGI